MKLGKLIFVYCLSIELSS